MQKQHSMKMRLKRGIFFLGLVVLFLVFSGSTPGAAQDGLSEEQHTQIDRVATAVDRLLQQPSYRYISTQEQNWEWTATYNGEVAAAQKSTFAQEVTETVIYEGQALNLHQLISLDFDVEGTGELGTAVFHIDAELRVVDNTVYVKAAYTTPAAGLPELPSDWIVLEGERTAASYPGLQILGVFSLADRIANGGVYSPFGMDGAQFGDILHEYATDVQVVQQTMTDEVTVEVMNITLRREAVPLFDPANFGGELGDLLIPEITDDPLVFTFILDEQGNFFQGSYTRAIYVPEVNIGGFQGAPEGTLLQINDLTSTNGAIQDVGLALQPTTAPEILAATSVPDYVATARQATELPWWNDRVFYEVFVRSFYDSDGDGIGDIRGLIEKLDYLNDGDPSTTDDLGITGLWLMPMAQSPSYHGYDVIDYYTIEEDYGTNADFLELIEEAHQRGIAVIVDLVMNHTSSQHPWFLAAKAGDADYEDWYLWSNEFQDYKSPWQGGYVWHQAGNRYYYGLFWEGMPDLNYRNPEVTTQMYDVIDFWLTDMGVDGFRLDAIRHLIENGPIQQNTPETLEWLLGFHDYVKSVKPAAFTVGEVWDTTANVVPYVGERVDTAFEFDLAGAMVNAARSGRANALYGVQERVLKSYPVGQYSVFLTNHDQERVMSQLRDDGGAAKVAATLLLTTPGVPFLYYGEEIGMLGVKPDERIRTPMQWAGDETGGFSSGRPWQALSNKVDERNVETMIADPDSLLSHYRALIAIRNAYPVLQTGAMQLIDSDNAGVYAFLRYGEEEALLVVVNLSKDIVDDYNLSLAAGLLEGEWRIESLLGQGILTRPRLTETGGFSNWSPVENLAPQSSYIVRLTPKS